MASEQNFPSDLLQIDIVGRLHPSGSYKFILTTFDVFSRYLFAVALVKQDVQSVAHALMTIFLRHSYIHKIILSDKGTVFTSQLIKELAQMLNVQLKYASLKQAQTIGLLERSHAALKRVLNVNGNETSSD